jgi:hypothetical protein
MVTSQKMSENKMGYRGSKSEILIPQPNFISVKEQRVDGSWCTKFKPMHLRCTLMSFEKNCPIKIPSKQLIKNFSTINSLFKVDPWFLTGFTDAEGSFSIIIDRNEKRTLGWRVQTKLV